MTNKPYVSLIVPIWIPDEDSLQMTKESLWSMEKTEYPNYDIIIVDDCSPLEGAYEAIQAEFGSRHAVVQTPENGGSTVAVNHGIQHTKALFIQYQNNDTLFPDKKWLDNHMQHFDDQSVGVVGTLLRFPDNTIQHAGACYKTIHAHAITHIGHHEKEIKPIYDVPFVTGCGMTVRREILDRNGGGFTVFEGYGWDDIDIQVKAKEWGYKVRLAFESTFTHFQTTTYAKRPELAGQENYLKNMAKFQSVEIHPEETLSYFKEKYYLNTGQ